MLGTPRASHLRDLLHAIRNVLGGSLALRQIVRKRWVLYILEKKLLNLPAELVYDEEEPTFTFLESKDMIQHAQIHFSDDESLPDVLQRRIVRAAAAKPLVNISEKGVVLASVDGQALWVSAEKGPGRARLGMDTWGRV